MSAAFASTVETGRFLTFRFSRDPMCDEAASKSSKRLFCDKADTIPHLTPSRRSASTTIKASVTFDLDQGPTYPDHGTVCTAIFRKVLEMISRRTFLTTSTAAAVGPGLLLRSASAEWRHGRPGFLSARDIAEAGYIFGLPIVMNYGAMYELAIDRTSSQFRAPFNTLYSDARVFTYKDTAIVTPNSDTPYSLLWTDLRAEPIVVSVPTVDPKRYYSVMLVDGNTYVYGIIGSRTTGNDAGNFLIAGPGWAGERPDGIKKVFQSSTDFSLAIFRTQLFSPSDIENVKAVQAGYQAQPLSSYLKQPAARPHPTPEFPKFSQQLAQSNFFEFLDFALQFAPALPNEFWIREQLARIGVGPGKTFRFDELPDAQKAEVRQGLIEGKKKVDAAVASVGERINGWNVADIVGDAAFYHGNWMLRAVAAQAGIFGLPSSETVYPMTRWELNGTELDGSKAKYAITFPKDGLPPVHAFWSITMYDGKTQLLIQNPIDRYLINSTMLSSLKKNADGSLTIYVQNASPGPEKEANWLPAPNGPIYMVMRLYWPKVEPPSILPVGRGTWQPPAVVRSA